MWPYLPSHDYEQLKETIARLLWKNFKKNNHPFIHPESIDGLAEQVAEKHDMELHDARQYIICLAARRALAWLYRRTSGKQPPPPPT